MVKITESTDQHLKSLLERAEEAASLSPSTPKDFERLRMIIFGRTGVLLSATTLKRLWGYIGSYDNPRVSTLNFLARFCGWNDYNDFLSGNRPEIESGMLGAERLRADIDVMPGERVILMWPPDRVCEVEYKGDMAWEVISAEATKLKAGDRFKCALIVSGEPLYLDNLRHGDHLPGVYVCGRRSGITFRHPKSS